MQTFTASVELNKNDNSSLEQIFGHQKKKKKRRIKEIMSALI